MNIDFSKAISPRFETNQRQGCELILDGGNANRGAALFQSAIEYLLVQQGVRYGGTPLSSCLG
jgi:hypothetical protein